MNYEYSYGAVLYRKNNNQYEYLIIKDRNDNYNFPKGHINEDEDPLKCVTREIKEEVGLDVRVNDIFAYPISYLIDTDITKSVTYYLAEINNEPYINDGEVKEILFLAYEDALSILSFASLKEVLKEANEYLVSDMQICCMILDGSIDIHNLELVKDYGDYCNGHFLHTFDDGYRKLFRCKKCKGYILKQYSEMHMPDATYIDYFPVRDEKHAEELNEKYNGFDIEWHYPYKRIFQTYND